jgi:hypothetical protein
MAWTTLEDFVAAIPLQRYLQAHGWHRWQDIPMGDLLSAWRLYKRAQNPVLGFILLGDTKIRQDPSLVQAFGLLTAGGVQDDEAARLVAALKLQGWWRGTGGPPVGAGSILSDRNWSPLLNDSLVLGGVHRQREFHFADTRLAGFSFQQPAGVAGTRAVQELKSWAAQRRLADLSDRPFALQVWRQFFQQHQSVLWDGPRRIPRVLAREMIGLMTMGYEARPLAQQLSFVPGGAGGGARAAFGPYLETLRGSGYFSAAGQPALLARISQFLFGRPDALLPA